MTFRHCKGGRSSAKRTGRLYPRRNPWYSLSEAESTSGHVVLSGVPRKKIPSDTTGNRSRDLPTSSAVLPQHSNSNKITWWDRSEAKTLWRDWRAFWHFPRIHLSVICGFAFCHSLTWTQLIKPCRNFRNSYVICWSLNQNFCQYLKYCKNILVNRVITYTLS